MPPTFGGLIPMSSYSSGCVRGSSTASLISVIWFSRPPTSAYDSVGALSTWGRGEGDEGGGDSVILGVRLIYTHACVQILQTHHDSLNCTASVTRMA